VWPNVDVTCDFLCVFNIYVYMYMLYITCHIVNKNECSASLLQSLLCEMAFVLFSLTFNRSYYLVFKKMIKYCINENQHVLVFIFQRHEECKILR
jgi:hypothetical protein